MGAFDDYISDMMEPYGGNMPLFNHGDTTDATVTIVQESYDDGMNITRIQTPPRTETSKLMDAINYVLCLMGDSCPMLDKPEADKPSEEKKEQEKDGDENDYKSPEESNLQSSRKPESGEDSDKPWKNKQGRS